MIRIVPLLLLATLHTAALAADDPPVIVEMPSVAQWVDAPFPEEAQTAGIGESRVTLRVATDAEGRVLDVQVVDDPGFGLGDAAMAAVLEMRFNPARTAEGPIPATFDFVYGFRPAAEPAPLAPINLQGAVREAGTRGVVADALVTITWAGERAAPAGPFELVSDDQGTFGFRDVPTGLWTVRVFGPRHLTSAQTVEVVAGEATEIQFWVKVDSLSENEITVYGERPKDPEVTRRTLTTEEIRRIPGTFGDPVKVIQTLPGAARSPFGTGLLIIRGANPEDSGVYIDGIRVPLIYHLTGTTSVIAPEFVESVDYLPGGYAARFGRTAAGTIDVRTKPTIDETILSGGADVLDAQVYAQSTIPAGESGKRWGVAVGARRSYIDAFLPLFLDDSAFAIKPRYWDYQVKVVAPTPANRLLSLFVYGFDDILTVTTPADRAVGSDADAQGGFLTRYNSHRVILRWDEEFSDNLTLRVTPSIGLDRTVFGVGQAFTFDGGGTIGQLRAELVYAPSEAITVTPGLDFQGGTWFFQFRAPLRLEDLDDPLSERDPVGFDGRGNAWYPDPWLRLDLRPLSDRDRLLLTPSVRLNTTYLTYRGDIAGDGKPFIARSVDPRFAGSVQVSEQVLIKGSTGLYHQPPQPQESIGLGTPPELDYERAWNSSVGVEHTVNPAIAWELEVFWRDMTKLIEVNDGFSGFGSQPFANIGRGRAYGAELIVRHQPVGRFFGWVSYTLSRSERKANPEADWTPFDFDQTHIFSAQGGYDLPFELGVSAQVQYVTGNPDTALNAGVFDADQGFYNGFRVGDPNGQRLPPFFQTSLRVDKSFTFKSWQLVSYIDLLNTVRGVNPEFTLYSYDFTRSAYVRGLPFIPNVGVEARVRR